MPHGVSVRAVTQTVGSLLTAHRFLTTASICLGIGMLAGLISLRAYHPSDDPIAASPQRANRLPIAVCPPEEATAATRLDDVMLVVLVVGLGACAAFVWMNLGRLMANG